MNLKERIEEICKKLELDAYPHQNYGVIEATTDILKAVEEIVPKEEKDQRNQSEFDWGYMEGYNQAIKDMKERLNAGGVL